MSEGRKKPWWLKLLISLISSILVFALLIVGACVFAKVKYNISVIDTISQIKILNENVNESEKFLFVFNEENKTSTKNSINDCFTPANLITYSETEGYGVNDTTPTVMTSNLSLTEVQCGALMSILLQSSNTTTFNISDQNIPFQLLQLSFENITETTVDFNVVIKLDITSLKDSMKNFPLSLIAGKIPNNLYISSFVTITKGETAFSYTTSSKSISINNLDATQTASLLKTINTFIKFGDVQELNKSIGGSFANALIGNDESTGFAYSLSKLPILASGFAFETVDGVDYFVINK